MIETQGLTKYYGEHRALENFTFSLERGDILGFLGPNGAGKTTMMRILTGYMSASEGRAVVAGYDVFEDPLEVKRRIGYLPETPPLYPEMKVRSYLRHVARLKGLSGPAVKAAADRAIERCVLQEYAGRLCGHLSKGYRQRVGLAQAILHNPDVLILDEPTIGLDPRQIVEIRKVISDLSGDHTVLLSTHILGEVRAICNRVLIVNRGRKILEDSLERFERGEAGALSYDLQLLAAKPELAQQLAAIEGVRNVQPHEGDTRRMLLELDSRDETLQAVSDCLLQSGAGIAAFAPRAVGLEEVFIRVVSADEARHETEAA